MPPTQAEEARDRRANIESEFNKQRADREQKYVDDRQALIAEYQADIEAIHKAKKEALLEEGLNSDGSDPRGRQQG